MKVPLIDLDGVLRHFPNQRDIGPRFGMPAGAIEATAFEPALLTRAITGAISDADWRAEIVDALCRVHFSKGE